MKTKLLMTILLGIFCIIIKAQTSPSPSLTNSYGIIESNEISSLNDTITFTPFISGAIITTQYLNKGVVFSGFDGSSDPVVFDYSSLSLPYGKILRSDNWYNPLRMNFVDTLNANQYHLAKRIEFDNIIDSELDYMSIDVYDSLNVLIYHYLSSSPEHVVLNFTSPVVAYITIDDSLNTAYTLDNILVDFGSVLTSVHETYSNDFRISPNPFSSTTTLQTTDNLIGAFLTVYNSFGQPVRNIENIFGRTVILTRDNLPSGLYFIRLTQDNKIILVDKLLINE